MQKTDLAYVAGIIDGEGCIRIETRNPNGQTYYSVRVSITHTNKWLLEWMKFNFGGSCYSHSQKKVGNKPLYQWVLSANQATGFLKLIYPYLRLKRPNAEVAFKLQSMRPIRTDEQKAVAEAQKILMSQLNHKGI